MPSPRPIPPEHLWHRIWPRRSGYCLADRRRPAPGPSRGERRPDRPGRPRLVDLSLPLSPICADYPRGFACRPPRHDRRTVRLARRNHPHPVGRRRGRSLLTISRRRHNRRLHRSGCPPRGLVHRDLDAWRHRPRPAPPRLLPADGRRGPGRFGRRCHGRSTASGAVDAGPGHFLVDHRGLDDPRPSHLPAADTRCLGSDHGY